MRHLVDSYFQAQKAIKIGHWITDSYAWHKSLDEMGVTLNELFDKLVEVSMGLYGRDILKRVDGVEETTGWEAISHFYSNLEVFKQDAPDQVANIVDEILAELDKLKYLSSLR